MAARFEDHPEAVAETVRLAETLTFDLTQDLGYRYPGAEDERRRPRPARRSAARASTSATRPGTALRDEAAARLEEELALIDGLGLSGFFLLHRDLLELAREVAVEVRGTDTARALLPPGRGRGSSVSSIVCYLTGLSHVDPVANKLFLGRFLNEEITALPDIDLDFPRDVREKLIPRVHERYGREHSALVAAFPDLPRARRDPRARQGARPAAGRDRARRARLRGLVARARSTRTSRPRSAPDAGAKAAGRRLAELSTEAYGLPRHLSQHSGGMIVATRPLVDCCPVVPAAMEGRQMVMWDKDSCSDAGFLKIDLLGLGMLSAVERCVEQIARARERADRPLADPLRRPRDLRRDPERRDDRRLPDREPRADGLAAPHAPGDLDDLTIQVAIVRPGPIQGGAVNPYIERRQRLRADPVLRGPLRPPVARAGAARHARHDHLPGPGASRSRWPSPASRPARPRACGAR